MDPADELEVTEIGGGPAMVDLPPLPRAYQEDIFRTDQDDEVLNTAERTPAATEIAATAPPRGCTRSPPYKDLIRRTI